CPVSFTRSRPYKKNDNAHVEQKNWSHVRQLLGYDRFEDPHLCPLINTLYRDYWEPLNNYFIPNAKLIHKTRLGSKIKKRHDKPMTPCDRLLLSPHIDKEAKTRLRENRKKLNPFSLAENLEKALNQIFSPGCGSGRPAASLLRSQHTYN